MHEYPDESSFRNEHFPDGKRPEKFDEDERAAIRRANAVGKPDLLEAFEACAEEVKKELEAVRGELSSDYFQRRPPVRTVVYVQISPGIETYWVKAY